MNLVKHYVKEILGPPVRHEADGMVWYTRRVRQNCHGRIDEAEWIFEDEETAENLEVGDWRLR
jgi:hypothetical protein